MNDKAMQPLKPSIDKRPWGEELWITDKKPSMVKLLSVNPGEVLSLQYHHNRDEYWRILSGDGKAIVGETEIELKPGDDVFVVREQKHRLFGGKTTLLILELAFGDFDENDIVHLEDKYGRT